METKNDKFKVGDKVICTRLGNSIEGDTYDVLDELEIGKEYTVNSVGSNGVSRFDEWIKLKETPGWYWHHIDGFKPVNIGIIVLLRRPVDRKAIERFLQDAGYKIDKLWEREYSRIIAVHTSGKYKGEVTFNAPVTFKVRAKEAIKNHLTFSNYYFGYKDHVVIKTKPSVSKAIVELEKYI